jgi:hypothetical protein
MKHFLNPLFFLLLVISCGKDSPETVESVITFNLTVTSSTGGKVSSSGGPFESGSNVSITATPDSEYVFVNWSNGSTDNPLSVTVNSNQTITSNFEKRKYPLTISITGSGTVSEKIISAGKTTTEYTSGSTIQLTANPSQDWSFVGWSGSVSSTENPIELTVNESKNVTVTFEISSPQLFSNKSIQIDQMLVTQPSILGFNDNTYYHETDQYIISKKGWLGVTVQETHNGGFYGTDAISPGTFEVHFTPIMNTDLNGDGLEDMIIGTGYGPNTVISNQTGIPFFSLINLGDGTFDFSQEYFSQDFQRSPMASYRSVVDDFNGDGEDDFILGMSGGIAVSQIDGGTDGSSETPILALSNGSGFYDNSENLNGINPGTIASEDDLNSDGIADFLSNRAISTGDFDNDGDIDFFMTEKILLNDGDGNFSVSSEQLTDDFIPLKLDPPYSNTYESHSNDFNNDGYSDIVIVPDSGYIKRNGGSAWVAMSNGTPNFSEWEKVPLPNPRYINNSKLNDLESSDIDNDGYVDLIIATTRDFPYYRGAGIQILRNNSGNGFIDITDTNIEDQSMFDQWAGEGDLILKDFNNDSVLDIIHLTTNTSDGPPNQHHGTNIYINNNGYFEIYDTENNIPFVAWNQFQGYQHFIDDPNMSDVVFTLDWAIPVNINNDGLIDFISFDHEISGANPSKITTKVFYTILSK